MAYEGWYVLAITPEVTPALQSRSLWEILSRVLYHDDRDSASESHRIDRRPHRGRLITFSIATGNRSRPAYRRLQAIRARIECRARTGRDFTATELLLTGLSPPILVRGASSKESLINSIVEDRIGSVMRRRPSEYLEYLSQIIKGNLSDHTVDRFCELCATRDLIVHSMLVRLTPKSTRFGDDFVGTLAHWMLARLSPLHFGCCHEPVYSPSYVGASACPLIPSNDRNALNG